MPRSDRGKRSGQRVFLRSMPSFSPPSFTSSGSLHPHPFLPISTWKPPLCPLRSARSLASISFAVATALTFPPAPRLPADVYLTMIATMKAIPRRWPSRRALAFILNNRVAGKKITRIHLEAQQIPLNVARYFPANPQPETPILQPEIPVRIQEFVSARVAVKQECVRARPGQLGPEHGR